MINTLPTKGAVRTPRSILMIGSKSIDWTSWRMEHNGIHEAGTIDIEVPTQYGDWPWWTQQTEIMVDVYAGLPSDPLSFGLSDLTMLMSARIDELRLNPKTRTISLRGRDLTSLLTDNKSDAKYPNLTASAIATMLATKAGLTPMVQPTKGPVGAFYNVDHVQLHRQQTPWTLLTYLAQHEGVQCFVLGHNLYFGNFAGALSSEPYLIQYAPPTVDLPYGTSNAIDMQFTHDLTLAGDISVHVRSFHGYKGAAFVGTAGATKTLKHIERGARVAQEIQRYDYTFSGLTKEACTAKAYELLQSISKHELKVHAALPGDTVLYPWTPLTVQGTGTPFDVTYEVARIQRTFDAQGFQMKVDGRTVPAQQTIELS
jgi:hypothetical protein